MGRAGATSNRGGVTVFLGMQKHRDFGSALWHGWLVQPWSFDPEALDGRKARDVSHGRRGDRATLYIESDAVRPG
jgi:hypothetical protein